MILLPGVAWELLDCCSGASPDCLIVVFAPHALEKPAN